MTHEQLEAITYAHIDVKAAYKLLANIACNTRFPPDGHLRCGELASATKQTLQDLEKAFPFLIEEN